MADTNEAQLLTELLGDVARGDAHLGAAHLESRVMQAAVRQGEERRRPYAMHVAIAAAAVVAVLVSAAFWPNTHVPATSAASKVVTSEHPIAATEVLVAPTEPQPARRVRPLRASRAMTPSPVTQRALSRSPITPSRDEFVPLMPMTEQELTGPFQLVRVQMPRASLGALRLPLEHPNELVEADVLLGEDGMARAIRVSTSGSTHPWRLR